VFISLTPLKRKLHIHRGQILQTAVDATRLKKEDVAEKAGYSRASYYKHVQEPELDYHILAAYGKALKYDFTEELPEMPKYVLSEPDESYGKALSLDEALRQRDHWRDKYLELLEKYNGLIEQRMKGK
jgi:hypothetical protein